ncbi:hypothetical protein MLD38_019867 [Melastoma candidum]|uniref:Uncharacterized protein n=1 Tax=Melastoma candidum TaxID=119954 RepID=A0ACB9QEX7_9MYRT|nr:hypothetical protein MLD38_019867 [Melastoma candidum]
MLNCPKLISLDFSGHMHSVFLKDTASVNEAAIHLHNPWLRDHLFCLYNAGTGISCGNMVEGEFLSLKLLLEKLRHCSRFKLCT